MLIRVDFADNILSVGSMRIHARPEDVETARLEAEVELAERATAQAEVAKPSAQKPPEELTGWITP